MELEKFYNTIRKTMTLTQENVRGFDLILTEAEKRNVYINDLAYILATTWHETAARMHPIAEYGKGKGRKYGVPGKYKQIPYGRGYVQLTWDFNYEKADKELKLGGRLLRDFDLALRPEIAIPILFVGMEQGWFTGKKLRDFIDEIDEDDEEDQREFEEGRKIINGKDKKRLIAIYALLFEKALKAARYGRRATEKPVEKPKEVPATIQPEVTKPSVQPSVSFWEAILKMIGLMK